MKKMHNVLLFLLFVVVTIAAFVLADRYKQNKINAHQTKQLESMAFSISNEVATLIDEKRNATLAMALAYTQNQEKILSLFEDPKKRQKLEELSLRIKNNSDFKNIWIQLVDKKGISIVRSWTERANDDITRTRPEVHTMLRHKKITTLISVGLHDLSIKAMVPIFDSNAEFVGFVEFISHFNSIAHKIKDKGYEPIVLVDKIASQKIAFPFTKTFVGSRYVANLDINPKVLGYFSSKNIEHFISKTKNYVIDEQSKMLIVNYTLFDADDKPMANVFMFKPLESIDYTSTENIRLNIDFLLIIFVLVVGFSLYLIANKEKKTFMATKKDTLFFIGLYIVAMSLFYFLLKDSYEAKEREFLENHQKQIDKEYNAVLEHFKTLARTMYEVVVNKPKVLSLIDKAYEGSESKLLARFELYDLLLKDYEFFRDKDLRQLHFHLKNNESFLRFHRPNLFGDDLTQIRKTVAFVNQKHIEISGYEEGKIYNGFRHVFPLFMLQSDGSRYHLGSVETSFSSYAVLKEFVRQKDTKVAFLLNKTDVHTKNFKEEAAKNYTQSEFRSFYYEQNIKSLLEHQFRHIETDAIADNAREIEKLAFAKEPFSIVTDKHNTIFTFIPIVNILSDDVAALLVVQQNDESFDNLKNNFIIFLFSGFVIITLLFLYIYKEFTSKRKLRYLSTKIQNIFDVQKEIVIVTNANEMLDANKRLLDFFGFENFEAFKKEHTSISEKFEVYEKVFYPGKTKEKNNWIEALEALPQKERIVAMSNSEGNKHIFNVFISKLQEEYIVSFSDISDTILEQFSLREKVKRDILTGAYNREFFDKNIDLFKIEAKNKNLYLGVVMFDIDFFKNVNDTYGHSCGDVVLIDLVKLMQKSIRKEDALIRWGGEEFLLLLTAESLESLERIVENLRIKVEEKHFKEVEHLTCSFGIAAYKEQEAIEDTIIRADRALYRAKANGRNQICFID